MSEFEGYQGALMRAVSDLISGMQDADHEMVRYSIARHLGHLDEESPPPAGRKLDSHEAVVERLFLGFVEVLQSVEALRNIAVYVRRFPYRGLGVDKGAYLRYHVENYLNELYILQERMKGYLTVIRRLYKDDPDSPRIDGLGRVIKRYFCDALAGTVCVRGAHVHQRRFSDHDLDRLSLFAILRTESGAYNRHYEETYRDVRASKRRWIEETNATIDQLLDASFGVLLKLLFDDEGRLRNPAALPNQRIEPSALAR